MLMSVNLQFNQMYSDVSTNIALAMADLDAIHVDNEEGRKQLSNMMDKLRTMQSEFNNELEFLQHNAEWEKFTIAFFGETNAGKSTIIESLRILFNEESRRQLLQNNTDALEQAERQIDEHIETIRTQLIEAYLRHASDIASLRAGTVSLAELAREGVANQEKLFEAHKRTRWILVPLAAAVGAVGGVGVTVASRLILGA